LEALTVTGEQLGDVLEWWERSTRRARLRDLLVERDGVEPDDVIMTPAKARERGLTSTVAFPTGNLAPEGPLVKRTSLDPRAGAGRAPAARRPRAAAGAAGRHAAVGRAPAGRRRHLGRLRLRCRCDRGGAGARDGDGIAGNSMKSAM